MAPKKVVKDIQPKVANQVRANAGPKPNVAKQVRAPVGARAKPVEAVKGPRMVDAPVAPVDGALLIPKEKKTKKHSKEFYIYIYRVLKQVHPDTGFTKIAITQINKILSILAEEFARVAQSAVTRANKHTCTSRDVQYAARTILPGEVAKHAVSEGTKAVTKYNNANGFNKSRSARAGLQFPVALAEKYLRSKGASTIRIGAGAPVYLAAILEYLCAEVLELAGNCARDNKRVNIAIRHVYLAVAQDEELNILFEHFKIMLDKGGVLPNIRKELVPARDENGKKKNKHRKAHHDDGVKRPHRFLPGTVALREIRALQRTGELMMQRLPFSRLVRHIAQDFRDDLRFSKGSILILQGFVEIMIVKMFTLAQELALHAKREGIMAADFEMANRLTWEMQKFMHDARAEIAAPALKRLARRGGVKRISGLVFDTARVAIDSMITEVIKHAELITTHNQVKTVSTAFMTYAIQDCGFNYISGSD